MARQNQKNTRKNQIKHFLQDFEIVLENKKIMITYIKGRLIEKKPTKIFYCFYIYIF